MIKNLVKIQFILFILMSSQASATNVYPDWFLYPAKYDQIIIGYTYNGMTAEFDAASMYCAFSECIVLGTLEIFENEFSSDLMKNSNYFYYFSPDSVETLNNRLVPIDRFEVSAYSRDSIYAYSLDNPIDLNAPWIKALTLPVPSWIEKDFFQDSDFYYGVGMYTAMGRENDGWKTAEEQAIFTILTALQLEVHQIQFVVKENDANAQTSSMEQISLFKIKYLIKNISVIERFPDKKNNLYYALVRIPKNSLVSYSLK